MSAERLGRILIVANPAACSGKGEGAVIFATRFFSAFNSAANTCEVRLTENPHDAERMAAAADNYDTIIALGGDGVIHEVVNGLMRLPISLRPVLGIIPMGFGNDIARTLGMTRNDPEHSIAELFEAQERIVDLGVVNGTYFVQTLSFGLDAAIALDATDRSTIRSRQAESMPFVTSGLKLLTTSLRGWPYRASIDDERVEGTGVAFAVQNGITYGGGFRICPDARPCDGMLDICMNVDKPSLPHSFALFGLARFGRHTHSKKLIVRRARHILLEFLGEQQPPCQIDGEYFADTHYDIRVEPASLRVLVSSNCVW